MRSHRSGSSVSQEPTRCTFNNGTKSALQLLLNVAVLIAIGAVGLRLQRIIWRARSPAQGPATDAPGQ